MTPAGSSQPDFVRPSALWGCGKCKDIYIVCDVCGIKTVIDDADDMEISEQSAMCDDCFEDSIA
jgi:hypothetical protein